MKRRHTWFWCLAFLLGVLTSSARAAEPGFSFFRWQEDYRYLADREERDGYDRFKYTPIGDSAYVSFGGSARQRLNVYDNDLFGLRGPSDGHLFLNRILIHGDVHFSDQLRTFVEFGSNQTDGDDLRPTPFDDDSVDITQAFVDLKFDDSQLRIGRQEMMLGSTRLVGVRNATNVRRAFDGVRFDTTLQGVDLRLFAFDEVQVREDGFDNRPNGNEAMWGAYSSWNFDVTNAELYYIGLYRSGARYAQGSANETRHSVGTRLFGSKDAWDWNVELVYQFGDFGHADIRAYTAASMTGYTFKDMPWRPRLSLSANIASGDDDPNDSTLGTFNPIYPNLMYFEEAAVLAPQNFFNLEPEVTIHPSDKLSVSLDWNFFWRLEENDAVYVRALQVLPGTANAAGSFVTHVPSLSVDYRINRHLLFDISYSHFFAQEVIENAGGSDIDFFKMELNWTF